MTQTQQPSLSSPRLKLRPFIASDADAVRNLAGHPAIAAGTIGVPHPYPEGLATQWIARHPDEWGRRSAVTFAIELKSTHQLVGSISLMRMTQDSAELGYWVGVPYWNRGYCTEAAQQLIDFGFNKLGLNRIIGKHLVSNPASGGVLVKCGFTRIVNPHMELWKNDEPVKLFHYYLQRSGSA